MRKLRLSLVCMLLFSFIYAQTFSPKDAGSKVSFVIKNFGLKTSGTLTGLRGTILFDPNSLNTSLFNVSVNSKTIDTDNSSRDNHLRKEEYFNVEKYPVLTFVSTKITKSTLEGRFYVFGNLTIKGVTKPIEFGFSATPTTSGYNFKGGFEINRRDFGVGGSSVSLSDNLKVPLNIVATKQ